MILRNLRKSSNKNYLNSNYLRSIPFLHNLFPYLNIILCIWIFSLTYAGISRSEINDYLFLSSLISFFIISLKIESKIVNFSILGPFTFTLFFQTIVTGIGIFLLSLDDNTLLKWNLDQLDTIKYAYLIGTPFKLIGFWLIFRFFKPAQHSFSNKIKKVKSKSLVQIGFLFLLFSLVKSLVFFFTGSTDRTLLDVDSVKTATSSISGIFTLFGSLSDIGYILVPFIIKKSKNSIRIVIYFFIFIISLFIILTGSRSGVINIFIFFFIGSIIFKAFNPQIINRGLIIFSLMMFIFIPAIGNFRNTSSFSSSSSVTGRINSLLFKDKTEVISSKKVNNLSLTGAALYGTMADLLIYRDTPNLIDHAGFKNFNSIFYIYFPKTFFPSAPSTFDGQEIAQEYIPYTLNSFASISFNADLYRRFSWIGVSIGNLIWGLSYGFISLILFNNYFRNPSSFSLLAIFCLYAFAQTQPQTVLNQCWVWLYNLPKFLIILYFISMIFNKRRSFVNHNKLDMSNQK